MAPKILLPLALLSNMLPILDGVYVHPEPPQITPVVPGPYRALIDTGSGNSWVKSAIGNLLEPFPMKDLVIDRGGGTEEDLTVDVRFGFMKGLQGKPTKAWVQLDRRLAAYECMVLAGDFDAPVDLVVGMDILCSFAHSSIIINGIQNQSLAIEDKI